MDIAEPGTGNDIDRALSPKGARQVEAAAAGLARLVPGVERIVSSPLRRAMETADILKGVLAPGIAIETCDALACESGVSDVVHWLREQPKGVIMLVGHMPSLAVLISQLVCGVQETCPIRFRKAGLCHLSCDGQVLPGTARIECLIPPAALISMVRE